MKVLNSVIIIISLLVTGIAQARENVWIDDLNQFAQLPAGQLNDSQIVFNRSVIPFADWAKQLPVEKNFLSLYPNYQEPRVLYKKDAVVKERFEPLMIFIVRAKAVINRSVDQLNVGKFLTIEGIQSLDPEIQHRTISPPEFMFNAIQSGSPQNFLWCDNSGRISRPAREVDLSWTKSPQREWCSDGSHSLCVESCYMFSELWRQGVQIVNLAMDEDEKKDTAAAMQWESRVLNNESELGTALPLAQLTGVSTPVQAVSEINMFYFNQIMHYGKSLAIFQPHPTDPGKTVMSAYVAIAVKKRTYDKHAIVGEVLEGKSMLNTSTGVTSGLPNFMQNLAASIVQTLE